VKCAEFFINFGVGDVWNVIPNITVPRNLRRRHQVFASIHSCEQILSFDEIKQITFKGLDDWRTFL
jgi:hypothetical protein